MSNDSTDNSTEYDLILVRQWMLTLEEVDAIARDMARRGLTGKRGDPLPNLSSVRACNWIDANQYAFRRKIENYRKYPNVPQLVKRED